MSDIENTDTSNNVDIDDLDALSSSLFGQKVEDSKPAEPASSEEPVKEEAEETSGDDTNTESDGDDTQEEETEGDESEEDSEDEEEDATEEPAPKPKRNRYQERITELVTARREAERRLAALEEQLNNPQNKEQAKTEAPTKAAELRAPDPTEKNEDGTEKYPLGEFDPGYIRDLTRHTFEEMTRESQTKEAQTREAREAEEKANQLQTEWNTRLAPAQERYPDYQEQIATLEPLFTGVDESYGEYLAQTLMAMDHGPDVLYYLAQNIDEAQSIFALGAQRATLKLGRIDATFETSEQEQPQPKVKRVTKAPTPPAHQNKGSAGARPAVPPDTDDLDAFAATFFKRP